MNNESLVVSKYTVSFGWSLALCSVFNALLVVMKEKSRTVANWMQRITGHHWVTHVLLVMVLFFSVGLLLARTNNGKDRVMGASQLRKLVTVGVLAGVAIILSFYLIAD